MEHASGGKKLWGGRFSGEIDPVMNKFNESLSVDKRMWAADIRGSKAYASALHAAEVISTEENAAIQGGLNQVYHEWENGTFATVPGDEDIHTANERRLTELIGSAGGKLHTGRSRNDQVATDVRIYLKDAITGLSHQLKELIGVATQLAESNIALLMPGFTHLQPAQPIRFAHWVMSHVAALQRDAERLEDLFKRVDVLPLGSGALAGNSFGIDRALLAKELNFARISPNSLDAVGDRDFIVEFLFWASMTMLHFSQLSEDLIIYNTLKFVTMADAYSTGSSLMPQKKNPDALELLRGKSGAVIGRLNGVMITLKGMPRSYNKDLQEDKSALFYVIDTMVDCIQIAAGVLATLTPNEAKMRGFLVTEMLATDLAEYLVRRGVPFRETHHVAGAAVRLAEDAGKALSDLTLAELQSLHPKFEPDVMAIWDFEASVERKNVPGGTSESAVQDHIHAVKAWIANSA
ncbi:argininosuccinate lyase [Aphanomyces invadans]|uniref:Argininosuccinate lyase n=1 Tax=Aphanomyces invadans TaxID=157072 RepID=A0A024U6K2_9STRA|nr:argininosuccinate lyase [Aphanomyces invadans]ETW01243.1 argininosuccinate lyase [Aphanomyces invadans]|eukprot:XP_008870241.1 argininosuccinate lyase [Aphanomyces invadans]